MTYATSMPAGHGFDTYLAELAAALPGPRHRRAAVLTEVLDGLCEAAGRHRAHGLTAEQASRAATQEFGTPADLAAAFAGELTAAQARQTVAILLFTGPLVGIWWLLLLAPASWWQNPIGLWTAIPVLPLIGAAAVTGAAVIATTGRLTRWLPETTPARALAAAVAIGMLCIAVDLTVLAVVAIRAGSGDTAAPPLLAATAVTASLIRLACATRAVRSCLRTRRTRPTQSTERKS
jgi:hypothetical protein